MAVYGPCYVSLYNQSLSLLDSGNAIKALKAEGIQKLNRIGRGKFEALVPPNESPTYFARGLDIGNIACVYMHDSIAGGDVSIATFMIDQTPELKTNSNGKATISVSGPDLTKELTFLKLYYDIGDSYDTTTTYNFNPGNTDIDIGFLGDFNTTPTATPHTGETEVNVNSVTGLEVGDNIAIELDNGGIHRTVVTDITSLLITFANPMPSEGEQNGIIQKIDITEEDSIKIECDLGSDHDYHYSRIKKILSATEIRLYHPLATGDSVTAGNAVSIISPNRPTSSDISQITRLAVDKGWTVDLTNAGSSGNGTADGTGHKADGISISRLLIAASELTGEFFRFQLTTPSIPNRKIVWRSTSDPSGITLKMPDQSNVDADFANTSIGVLKSISRETTFDIVTEVVPRGGGKDDTYFDLSNATEGDEGALTAFPGFSQVIENGQWVVKNDSASLADYTVQELLNASDIKPLSSSATSLTEAADKMQERAVNYLSAHNGKRKFFRATCYIHGEVYPGQSITLDFDSYAPHWDENNITLYIVEVRHYVNRNDKRETSLLLTDQNPTNRPDGFELAARDILSGGGAVTGGALSSVVGSGGGSIGDSGGGTGGVTDHGNLTGLEDDDHTQYLLIGGSRPMIGQLKVDMAFNLIPLRIQGALSQSYDLQTWEVYDGTVLAKITVTGGAELSDDLVINGGNLQVIGADAGDTQGFVRMASGQTANIFEIQNSSGQAYAGFDERGILFSQGGVDNSNFYGGYLAGNPGGGSVNSFALGARSLRNSTGNWLTAIGYQALEKITSGNSSTGIGNNAARFQLGSHNIAIGSGAFAGTTDSDGDRNVIVGNLASGSHQSGNDNIGIGYGALGQKTSSNGMVAIGKFAGQQSGMADYCVFLGQEAGRYETNSHRLYIANSSTINPLIYGEFDNNFLKFNADVTIDGNLAVGDATNITQAAIKAIPTVGSDFGLYIVQRSDQTASIVRFEDSSGSALILLTKDGDLESGQPGFVSGLTGWQIDHLGNAEFNNLVARGEFHASVFVADEMHAAGGTLAIMSSGILHSDSTLPGSINNTFTLNVQASYDTGLCPFAVNDILRAKFMVNDGVGLDIYDIYMEVEAQGSITGRDLANSEPGYYPMTVTWRLNGAANLTIPAKTAIVKWGEVLGTGGSYVGGMILTSDLSQAPYMDVFTLPADHTWGTEPLPTPRVRVGNLDGVLGLSEQWGIALGKDLSDTSLDAKYIVASDQQLKLNNVDLSIYDTTNNIRVSLTADGDLALGTDVASLSNASFYHEGVSGELRIGRLGTNKPNLYWNGSDLAFRINTTEYIRLDSDGNSYFAGTMIFGPSGELVADNTQLDSSGLTLSPDVNMTNDDPLVTGSGFSYETSAIKFESGGDELGTIHAWQSALGNSGIVIDSYGDATLGDSNHALTFRVSTDQNNPNEFYINMVRNQTGAAYSYFKWDLDGSEVARLTPDELKLYVDGGFYNGSNKYLEIYENSGTYGLGIVKGYGRNSAAGAIEIAGDAPAANTTEGTSSNAPVRLNGLVNGAAAGSDQNVVVMQTNGTTHWIMKGNGRIYNNYGTSMTAYDEEDDFSLLSSVAKKISPHILEMAWEDFTKYREDDLDRLDIVKKSGFVNEQNLNRLFIGAIRQMNSKIFQLEKELAELRRFN